MAVRVWFSWLVMLVALPLSSAVIFPSPVPQEKEASYWYQLMGREIQDALQRPKNEGKAKNIILFLGDGMGVTVSTAGRILKGQKEGVSGEEGYLTWERFPNIALLKTYNLDKQVPDSAATATAYLAGVKANYETIGVSGKVTLKDCDASLLQENRLDSILQWAQDAGKDTGVVTTTQVTHATPAALYAKIPDRYWQCDTKMIIDNATHCKDIARQLVEDEPGRTMKVILGGGRQEMGAPQQQQETKQKCPRTDGRNLVQEWVQEKEKRGVPHAYVTSTRQLRDVPVQDTDYLLGLFGDIHTPYEVDRDGGLDGTPSLQEMVLTALMILQKNPHGFFLLVEGGMIDRALHNSSPRRALEELIQLEEAVKAALEVVNLEETLVIVTADHSHTLTMAGYPPRGNDIFGVVTNKHVTDGLPYTTLMFTTGHGYNYTWDGQKVTRPNLTGVDTGHKDYVSLAAVPTAVDKETHGGEDVAVFATGPMSHLFHRTHEQTFVAHVMAFSACIGPYKDHCARSVKDSLEDVDTDAGEGHAGEGHAGEGHAGEGHAGEGQAGEVQAGEGNAGEGNAGEVHAGEGHAGEGNAGEGNAGEVHAGEGHAGEVHAGEGHAGEGHAGEGHAEKGNHSHMDNGHSHSDSGHRNNGGQIGMADDNKAYISNGNQSDFDVDFAPRASNVRANIKTHRLKGGSSRLAPSNIAVFLLALLGLKY